MGRKKVCIIGGGAGGLIALYHVRNSDGLEGTLFEGTGEIGGVWKYDGKTPMYRGLKTNLPTVLMRYLDYEFKMEGGEDSFVMHGEVLRYLKRFVDEFGLKEGIRFNCKVTSVKRKDGLNPGEEQWIVTYEKKQENIGIWTQECEIFDSVIICNGHFDTPYIPSGINGLHKFKGILMHSKFYNTPVACDRKRVVVFGAGNSGVDIALEVIPYASEVTLSLRNPPFPGTLPRSLIQKPPIKEVLEDKTVVFEDGSSVMMVDVIIVCTGYQYSLPFIYSSESGLKVVDGKYVTPLHKQMINIEYPSIALIGIPFKVCPFIVSDAQVRFYLAYLEGKMTLPSKEEMLLDLEKEEAQLKEKNTPLSHYHVLSARQWSYVKELAEKGGFSSHPLINNDLPLLQEIYNKIGERRKAASELYKGDRVFVQKDADGLIKSWSLKEVSASSS